jgi:hypothetical protein
MLGRFCATTGAVDVDVALGRLSSPHEASVTRLATAAPMRPRRNAERCDLCVVIVVLTGYVGSPMLAMTLAGPKFDFCVAINDCRYSRGGLIAA